MSSVHMFDTYTTLNYEEEIKNRPIPENAVNVLAAFKRNGEIKPLRIRLAFNGVNSEENIDKIYATEYYKGYIIYRCRVVYKNMEYPIKLNFVAGYFEKWHKYSIILGKYRNGRLLYKGHVNNGVTQQAIIELNPQGQPSIALLPASENVVWVIPDRVCTVNYMPNTRNVLQEAVFKGYRYDVLPKEVIDD